MTKPTFRIEPAPDNHFVVVRFDRSFWKLKRTVIYQASRLQEAELHLCGVLDAEYMKELDRANYKATEYNVEHLYPRDSEEQVYTALILAGHRPPGQNELYNDEKKANLIEQMLGRLEPVERRLFEGRFMSWYAKENPDYYDPRRSMAYGDSDFFARPAAPPGMPVMATRANSMYRRLWNSIRGANKP